MTEGSKVRIVDTDAVKGRGHLLEHARRLDVGQVAAAPTQYASIDKLYVRVKFANCRSYHRFNRDELVLVP